MTVQHAHSIALDLSLYSPEPSTVAGKREGLGTFSLVQSERWLPVRSKTGKQGGRKELFLLYVSKLFEPLPWTCTTYIVTNSFIVNKTNKD